MGVSATHAIISTAVTRRGLIAGAAVAFGSLALRSNAFGRTQPAKAAAPNTMSPCAIHQVIEFTAGAQQIFDALLDSKKFAAFSGEAAVIGREAGSSFSMFGGKIVGRNIELLPSRRIVQAWRPAHWAAGVYSIVKFELSQHGSTTTVVLDHTGFPDGTYTDLTAGWPVRYWQPLKTFLA